MGACGSKKVDSASAKRDEDITRATARDHEREAQKIKLLLLGACRRRAARRRAGAASPGSRL
jgi:hypothetical protein